MGVLRCFQVQIGSSLIVLFASRCYELIWREFCSELAVACKEMSRNVFDVFACVRRILRRFCEELSRRECVKREAAAAKSQGSSRGLHGVSIVEL